MANILMRALLSENLYGSIDSHGGVPGWHVLFGIERQESLGRSSRCFMRGEKCRDESGFSHGPHVATLSKDR